MGRFMNWRKYATESRKPCLCSFLLCFMLSVNDVISLLPVPIPPCLLPVSMLCSAPPELEAPNEPFLLYVALVMVFYYNNRKATNTGSIYSSNDNAKLLLLSNFLKVPCWKTCLQKRYTCLIFSKGRSVQRIHRAQSKEHYGGNSIRL